MDQSHTRYVLGIYDAMVVKASSIVGFLKPALKELNTRTSIAQRNLEEELQQSSSRGVDKAVFPWRQLGGN